MTLHPFPLAVLLDAIEARGHLNDADETDRSRKMLNLERETARFLILMLRACNRTRVLEIGTSTGFSTLCLASALPDAVASLTSIERDESRYLEAARNVRAAGFGDRVQLRLGEASAIVRGLDGPFDCVFFDADRVSAPEQLAILLPKLTPECLLLADNALSHPEEMAAYRVAVEGMREFTSIIVPIGKGLHVAHRRSPPGAVAFDNA